MSSPFKSYLTACPHSLPKRVRHPQLPQQASSAPLEERRDAETRLLRYAEPTTSLAPDFSVGVTSPGDFSPAAICAWMVLGCDLPVTSR